MLASFEQPVVGTAEGLAGQDLVLDLYIEPDGEWRWKDCDDFEAAIEAGVFLLTLKKTFEEQAQAVLRDVSHEVRPFAP